MAQNIIAALIVIAAAFFCIRHFLKGKCGCCDNKDSKVKPCCLNKGSSEKK